MNKKFISIFITFLFTSLWAQELPLGQFKEYLPYNKFRWVAQDSENIYAATNNSILVVDQSDGAMNKWSNLNGLSDIGIQTMHSDAKGRLIIAYTNSNVDVIEDYKVYNIRDILNKQLTGSKMINNISFYGDLAYLACDFGVVVIDLKTILVKDSWFTINNNISYSARYLTIHNERYYLATDKGIFSLPVAASNPANFSLWEQENELPKSVFRLLCSYQDKLFAVQDCDTADALFVYKDSLWICEDSVGYYRSFDVRDDKLLVCSWGHIEIFSGDSLIQQFSWERPQSGYDAIFDKKMNVWIADNNAGLLQVDLQTYKYKTFIAEGPVNSITYGLCFLDGELAVVHGARSTAIIPVYSQPAISVLKDDTWWSSSNFNKLDNPYGLNSVAINPRNPNEIFIASWMGGLFKMNKTTDIAYCYNSTNSPLESTRLDSIIFVSGLAIDRQNNLWMANTDVVDFIKVKVLNSEEEKWYSFNMIPDVNIISGSGFYAEHILIDSRNYKWITIPSSSLTPSQRLVVFFENGSLDNDALHKRAEVNLNDMAEVKSSRINCIAEDREGRIWVGSDKSVKVIYDAASVFNRTVYAKNILIAQLIGDTSYWQPLLEHEYITCITVDAADRKWIGTRNAGVFLISPNGTEEIFHFTTDNSPIFSNQINDIKINPENGEVFIATQGGLISYKGTATVGKENYNEVLVYPNPVREDYYGPVAVKGLMEDSFCKITDASGKLVWQGYAYGGQLIWNGKDFNGNRPATGVYFVMVSSKTGKEKKVAKFLFIQ